MSEKLAVTALWFIENSAKMSRVFLSKYEHEGVDYVIRRANYAEDFVRVEVKTPEGKAIGLKVVYVSSKGWYVKIKGKRMYL